MKRYFYIVWLEGDFITSAAIDADPADWLIQKMKQARKESSLFRPAILPFITNQFEITAEQYKALEALQ